MRFTKTIKNEVEVEALPCLKCGGTELDFWQDRKYDTGTVTCKKCKQEYRGSCSWLDESPYDLIVKFWNPANDPKIVGEKKIAAAKQMRIDADRIEKEGKAMLSKLTTCKECKGMGTHQGTMAAGIHDENGKTIYSTCSSCNGRGYLL